MDIMLFIQFLFLLFIIPENIQLKFQSLKSVRKFVVELRNDSDSMIEYVAKIQAIFCPEQPFCGVLASETRQSVMNTLPETLNVENNTIPVDQLQALIGVCCLPCSCEDNCKVDNNCCLTKTFGNETINVETESKVNSECIASSSKSHRENFNLGPKYSYYFMTTQCFTDKTSSIQSNCETPNPYDMADTIPVTSLRSGRTYWNQHCAKCNNDAANLVFWNMTAIFQSQFAFYRNFYSSHLSTDNEEEFYNQLLKHGEIVFTPPLEIHVPHKRCFPKELQITCRKTLDDIHEDDYRFLYEICDMVTLPVVTGVFVPAIRKNVFCYFCDEETTVRSDKSKCSLSTERQLAGAVTGLLNYRPLGETESSSNMMLNENGQCLCNEIFDTYQGKCIPVFCPPGAVYSGCHCTELLETVSGMPVILKLKATPEPGSLYPSTDAQAAKFRKTLRKAVQKFLGHVSVDIVASFRQQNETTATNSYRLYVAVIRSDFGHDTKETLKPLLDSFLKVTANKERYSIRLANKIMFRDINNHLWSAFDLQDQIESIQDYSDKSFDANIGIRIYQEFSPILFCKLVQLDSSQFTEKDGQIVINTTTSVLTVSDYYLIAEKEVRVCEDQYLPHLPSSGNTKGSTMMPLISCCFCTIFLLLNAKEPCIFAKGWFI